jgi:hypothetical protein
MCALELVARDMRAPQVTAAKPHAEHVPACLPACSSPVTPGPLYRCCAHVQVVPTVLDLEDVNYGPGGGYYGS